MREAQIYSLEKNLLPEICACRSASHSRLNHCKRMDTFDDQYHKLNKNLLRFFGLWPFEKTKFENCRAICFYILLISYATVQVIFQLFPLLDLSHKFNKNIKLEYFCKQQRQFVVRSELLLMTRHVSINLNNWVVSPYRIARTHADSGIFIN